MPMEISIWSPIPLLLTLLLFLIPSSTFATTFTFLNKCPYTVWPGILSNAGSPPLTTTGFQLPSLSSRSFPAPTGWSGRFWGRTGCSFPGTCSTGDCGSGRLQCAGAGAQPPATLAEFTLGTGTLDFYDVSLVDGYNLPVLVSPTGGSGSCGSTGCVADLNRVCPAELRVGGGDACRSACEAFGRPEYCCSGEYATPATCRPSVYSQLFKTACPRSYSYAYDDPTSTFTCKGADYTITFCPSGASSQKSTTPVTPPTSTTPAKPASPTSTPAPTTKPTTTPSVSAGSGLGSGSVSMSYDAAPTLGGTVDSATGTASVAQPGSTTGTTTTTAGGFVDGSSYLARMAMGDSSESTTLSALHSLSMAVACSAFVIIVCYIGL